MKKLTDIGYLGLGHMGSAIAERLLGQSFKLHVYDPSAAALEPFAKGGAVVHASPRAVADAATVVFACLPSQQVSLDVALGEGGVSQGRAIEAYVEMSTIGKETIDRIATGLTAHGVQTIDAPVTGGPPVARAGNLTLLTSGDLVTLEALQPLFALMGRNIYTMGDRPGMGQAMKMVNNIIMAANVVVAAEGLTFGAKAGLDAGRMLDVLRKGTGQSFAACEILQRGVSGTFDYGAALTILDKDMTLGMHEADVLGLKLPVIEEARDLWHAAYQAGWGERDFTTILAFVEEANGTRVRTAQ
jgi:3-hydroxyisobutyrate dehydrogenase